MTMTAPTLHILKIEDREGNGHCRHCDREGLRWICTLSDGTQVGTECAKKILGYRPQPKHYNWVPDFAIVAEHDDRGVCYVMWQRKGGVETRETRNGGLTMVGGVRQEWVKRGWLA